MHTNNIIKGFVWLLSLGFFYLFICYTEWSFDIAQWSIVGRWLLVVISIYTFPFKPKQFVKI